MVQLFIQSGQKMYYVDFNDNTIKEVTFYSFLDNDIYNINRHILVKDTTSYEILNATYNKNVFFKRTNARNAINHLFMMKKNKEIDEIQRGNTIRNQIEIDKRTFRLYD